MTHVAHKKENAAASFGTVMLANASIWHDRLSHVSYPSVHKVLRKCGLEGSCIHESGCTACAVAKSHRLPYITKHVSASEPFDLVYLDIWGYAHKIGLHNGCYSLLLIDNCTHFLWIYFLNSRD